MAKMKYKFAMPVILAGWFTIALNGAAAQDIETYSVPKGHPALSQSATAMPLAPPAAAHAPLRWTTPAGWKELPPTTIRIGNFLVTGGQDKKAEVAITSFPGSVGTELDNVNRWRGEVGMEPVEQDNISSQPIEVDSRAGKLYDFVGPAAETVVVSLPHQGATWFFKLRGDKAVVSGARAAFLDFLKSVHFSEGVETQTTSAPLPAMPSSPSMHSATFDNTKNEPQWNPPSNWNAKPSGQMVMKSFSVNGDNGQNATVAISVFPGDVGGTFANVNRWRSQLGLAPVAQSELSKVTEPLPLADGAGVLVDFANAKVPGSQPTRLVAAMVRHDDRTWFYKILGDDSLVAREKEGFVKFVQAVRYP
jgi:hypothetical protein